MPALAMATSIRAHALPDSHVTKNGGGKKPATAPNHLSLVPREVAKGNKRFDDDGPGGLSAAGKRHDNDHVKIRDIQILPTTDEILAQRAPYMPYKCITQPHFLPRGPERLVDTLFRQLRHDNVEILKDCTYAAAQKLASTTDYKSNYDPRQETPNGNRHYLYWGAKIEELGFEDRKGLMVRVSFACPRNMRGRNMFRTGRLEKGMVAALVGLDDDGVSLSVTFFEIVLRQSTNAMEPNGGQGKRGVYTILLSDFRTIMRLSANLLQASVELLLAEKNNEVDVRRIVNYFQGPSTGRFVLVEFPKILLAGFYPVLKKLQSLDNHDLGMTNLYAPRSKGEGNVGVLPPIYACRDSAFLDTSVFEKEGRNIFTEPLGGLIKNKEKFLKIVKEESTLNDAQAEAFVHSMSSQLAFVQGPPGTGKTYLGVALAKAILAARGPGKKPILVVCTTNHALDSFLENLLKQGITDIARLGGGSKAEWTKKFGVSSLTNKARLTGTEAHMRGKAFSSVNQLASSGSGICEAVNSPNKIGWYIVAKHLEKNYKSIYNQLVVASHRDGDLDTSKISEKAASFPYKFWSSGGDLTVFDPKLQEDFAEFLGKNNLKDGNTTANAEILASVLRDVIAQTQANSEKSDNNIWLLPLSERQQMLEKWAAEIDQEKVSEEIIDIHVRHQKAVAELKDARHAIDARFLAEKKVIGATTTACATNWDLLKRMGIEVVICEEAGQVMEAHSIITLLQSIEHAIFIGDPLQLRPQVNEQSLSLETKLGAQYRLDESLFERLMDSNSGIPALPYTQLNIQKRMHPDISLLLKKTLYPNLQDHPSTLEHPSVQGLANRTYWLDHRIPENDSGTARGSSKSFSNTFEVGMVDGLVRYLVNTNAYGLNDIAVLTPYNGQLAELTSKLSGKCKIWLNEKDRQALVDDGFFGQDKDITSPDEVNMSNMLRISTIDNFQGEEAKIVILTAVRSNAQRRPGFLRTNNRINVACSRARDGFYVIGNSACLETVPMWKSIVDVFKKDNCLGPSLRMMPCSRKAEHSVKSYEISHPSHFDNIPDFAIPRNYMEHELSSVKQSVTRSTQTAAMLAKRTVVIHVRTVGVWSLPVKLWSRKSILTVVTSSLSNATLKMRSRLALRSVSSNYLAAMDAEGSALNVPSLDIRLAQRSVERCLIAVIAAMLDATPGNHALLANNHAKPNALTESVHLSAVKVASHAPNWSLTATCDEPKDYEMPCGHIFPGICGEKKFHSCDECKTGSKPTSAMISLSCGHNIEVGELDRHVKFPSVHNKTTKSIFNNHTVEYDLTCPTCGKEIDEVLRYSVLHDIRYLPRNIEQLISEIGHRLADIGKGISHNEIMIRNTFPAFRQEINENPLSASENRRLVQERGKGLMEVQDEIVETKNLLVVPFENDLKRLGKLFDDVSAVNKYSLQFAIRFDLLFYRCRHAFLQELLDISNYLITLGDPSYQTRILAESLCRAVVILGTDNIKELGQTIGMCGEKKLPCVEVELRLLQLSIYCLVQRARKINCLREKAVNDNTEVFNVSGAINDKVDKETMGRMKPRLDTEASLTRIFELGNRFPRSAGKYLQQANGTKASLKNGLKPRPIFTEEARIFERGWGGCRAGRVTKCANDHPHPAGIFEDCPECGHEKIPAKEQDYGALLQEDKFLTWMRSRG
ncbi:hypothetical protein FQN54_001710 [Arachnomyces sp. PD_36]|nr:hypothetical protein FQN54_001710 [Arachnomyces sp. PD_36]